MYIPQQSPLVRILEQKRLVERWISKRTANHIMLFCSATNISTRFRCTQRRTRFHNCVSHLLNETFHLVVCLPLRFRLFHSTGASDIFLTYATPNGVSHLVCLIYVELRVNSLQQNGHVVVVSPLAAILSANRLLLASCCIVRFACRVIRAVQELTYHNYTYVTS